MDPLDPAIVEMWDKYRAHYPDPERPVHSALMEASVRRLERLLVVLPPSDANPAELHVLFPEVQRLTDEIRELGSYLGENPLLVPSPPGRLGEFLIEQGFSFGQAQHAVESAARPLLGRPTTARVRAVRALEMKRQGLSWRRIAQRLCPCGVDRHDDACVQRIRQAVLALQGALEKLQIILP